METDFVTDFIINNPQIFVALLLGLGVLSLLLTILTFVMTYFLNDSVNLTKLKKAGMLLHRAGVDLAVNVVNKTPTQTDNDFLVERLNDAGYSAYIDTDGKLIVTASIEEDSDETTHG